MKPVLRILMLEDVTTDALLIQHELRRAGIAFDVRRVQTEAEFATALTGFAPDLVLADYSLPGYDGLSALALVRRGNLDLPFIFVSGAIGEERAIEALRTGATDYVLKDRLGRLGPAVQRALQEAEEKRRRQEAEASRREALAQREAALQSLEVSRQQLQELSRRLVEVQENERRAIARELHDEAGQSLTALQVGLGLIEREPDFPVSMRGRIRELKQMVDGVLEGLHNLAVNLRPASLDRLGLEPALRQYVAAFGRQMNLTIDMLAIGLEGTRLCPEIETAIYRIVQEALTNVARHAQATHASVLIERRNGDVISIIEDDGVGFDPEEALGSGRIGLFGMRERAETFGGSLTIESTPGTGTTVYVTIPCDAELPTPS